jgi:NADH dehydrogenase FAD-containing subunit
VAFDVVIAGGGFGGLYAARRLERRLPRHSARIIVVSDVNLVMMPGMARRVRLAADWTVGLLFGRASAELGQLGHPPSLETYLDEARHTGEAPGQ